MIGSFVLAGILAGWSRLRTVTVDLPFASTAPPSFARERQDREGGDLGHEDQAADDVEPDRDGRNDLVDIPDSVCYQGTTPASSKNPPVGPSSGSAASLIAIAAPCSGVRKPRKPLRSVAV